MISHSIPKLDPYIPAIVLAPMDGLADAPMRAVQGEMGGFTFAVSEFLRVSADVPPAKLFHRHIPELRQGGRTKDGLPVQVQLLGGHPGRMAEAAVTAWQAGAQAIDINFGCPAPTVNRHDGGATLLKHPERIREIVAAIRAALPPHVPVSAKLRLGWDSIDSIYENAERAAEGGASWLTIHGRTRVAGYRPPAYWGPIGVVRERLGIPVVANGDIWSLEDFRRCREETGCLHFMLGRGALADPRLARRLAGELGIGPSECEAARDTPFDWLPPLRRLVACTEALTGETAHADGKISRLLTGRLKQWLKIAYLRGNCPAFESIKLAATVDELFAGLASETAIQMAGD